jgi:hypothetical protein
MVYQVVQVAAVVDLLVQQQVDQQLDILAQHSKVTPGVAVADHHQPTDLVAVAVLVQ